MSTKETTGEVERDVEVGPHCKCWSRRTYSLTFTCFNLGLVGSWYTSLYRTYKIPYDKNATQALS